jgi:histidinol dehydrogenase
MIKIAPINSLEELGGYLTKKDMSISPEIVEAVKVIVNDVRANGDEAVAKYTRAFDGVKLEDGFRVSEYEVDEAYRQTDENLLAALEVAALNINAFHEKQLPTDISFTTKGNSELGFIYKPIRRVGVYVPGGLGAYPSTVLMNVIPAKIAGVKEIAIFTPPDRFGKIHKSVAACAKLLGIDEVYKIGGAQAISAAAFGTSTIKKVDKIIGPGNAYVACAKREVYGYAAIDTIAGPSEILVIADRTANPLYIASDMLSQAEHDAMAKCYLITDSYELAQKVIKALKDFVEKLSRKDIITKALENSFIFIVKDYKMAFDVANIIAPEHLELLGQEVEGMVDMIENAGAVFVGDYSPEPIGDYIAGTNHVLPTDGNARFSSGLCVMDFMKHTSLVKYSKEDFTKYAPFALKIAENEELTAHANSLRQRLQKEDKDDYTGCK